MNLAELAEIGEACEIVKEALELNVILVADSGFRRKELLRWLKKDERIDFVIRLEGKLTVLLDTFVRRGKTRALQRLRDWMMDVLRTRFARPPVLTQGRFMRLIAMDFPSPCLAGGGV